VSHNNNENKQALASWRQETPVCLILYFSDRESQYRLVSNYQINAQFLYSTTIYMLHYNPRHVSSSTMLIFRRSVALLQHLVPSFSVNGCTVRRFIAPLSTGVLYSRLQRLTIPDAVIIQLTSWRWAWYCSKHVEDYNVTYILLYNKGIVH
jgi:hypothetical protein